MFCAIAMAQLTVTEIGKLPVRVTNNAVCEGFIDGTPYLFSFGGCDSTRTYKGVHKKCYRVNLETKEVLRLPNLPDADGKMAAAATRIGNIIYIGGGYYEYENEAEFSSSKMHRYDIKANKFLEDAPDMPFAVADHVQVVWKDKLIYVVSGWKDVENIKEVQIYDPEKNTWSAGSSTWDTNSFKAFGAAGVVVADTIFYFGGAASTIQYPVRYQVRRGHIDPANPTSIKWSRTTPDIKQMGYRTVGAYVNEQLHWVGGSEDTYGLSGESYNSLSMGQPSNRMLTVQPDTSLTIQKLNEIPMDLRGLANISEHTKYIAGGMLADAEVTNKIYKLQWNRYPESIGEKAKVVSQMAHPNPFANDLMVRTDAVVGEVSWVSIYNVQGKQLFRERTTSTEMKISTQHFENGIYFIHLENAKGVFVNKVIKGSSL